MKKADITIGGEYAVNPDRYGRANQAAGDARLAKGVIHSYVEGKHSKPGTWLVTLPDGAPNWRGEVENVGKTIQIPSRQIIATWAEHVPAKERRKKAAAEARRLADEKAAQVEAACARLREVLPADLLPYWVADDRFPRSTGQISVTDLLKIAEHVPTS